VLATSRPSDARCWGCLDRNPEPLAVGTPTPHLEHAVPNAGATTVILADSSGAVVAAALVALLRTDGPYRFPLHRFSWGVPHTVFTRKD
jgi:hypothetical protein